MVMKCLMYGPFSKSMHGITLGIRSEFAFSGFVINERSALAVQ
jgi:hypothetical protein